MHRAGSVIPLLWSSSGGSCRAIGLVRVSPDAEHHGGKRGSHQGASAMYGRKHVGRSLWRYLPVCMPRGTVGGVHDQAQREPDSRSGRGVAGQATVAGVVMIRWRVLCECRFAPPPASPREELHNVEVDRGNTARKAATGQAFVVRQAPTFLAATRGACPRGRLLPVARGSRRRPVAR